MQSPFSVEGKSDLGNTLIKQTDIQAAISNAELEGDITLAREAPLTRLSANLQARSPDVFGLAKGLADIEGPKDTPMRLNVQGDFADATIALQQLDLRIGDAKINATGRVTEAPAYTGTKLSVSAQVPDIAVLGLLAGLNLPSDALDLNFSLSSAKNKLTVNDLRATLGNSDLQGKLTYADGDVPDVTIALTSAVLDLSDYTNDPEVSGAAASEKTDTASGTSSKRVIPDTAIPVTGLTKANVNFDVSVKRLINKPWRASNLRLSDDIKDGALRVEELELQEDNGGHHAQFGFRLLS